MLWPTSIVAARLPDVAVDLHDVGASAGLNLVADRLPWPWQDPAGTPLVTQPPKIGQRTGYDHSPLDPSDPISRLWLRACIWPGQTDRLTKLDAALDHIDPLHQTGAAPRLIPCSAREVPSLLDESPGFAIAYQTVMRGYLPDDESRAYEAGMREWLRAAKRRALWVELEPVPSEDPPERSTAITAHIADTGGDVVDLELARCHPHPRRLHAAPDAVARLRWLVG